MSVMEGRGGIPSVFRDTIDVTGRKRRLPFTSKWVVARNGGANIVRMYFTEAAFIADEDYVELPVAAASDPHGEWAGPVEAQNLWFRAAAATSAIEVVAFQRRA